MATSNRSFSQRDEGARAMRGQIEEGNRFAFDESLSWVLRLLNNQCIEKTEGLPKAMVPRESLSGKRFLNVGNYSRLFSPVVLRLVALVHFLDFFCPADFAALPQKNHAPPLGFNEYVFVIDVE